MPNSKPWRVVHYETADGRCPIADFLDGLLPKDRAKVLSVVDLLEEEGASLRRPHADTLRDGIHELRVRTSGLRYRVLFFFCDGRDIVLTHGFKKKAKRVPETEIGRARRYRKDWLERDHENA